MRVKDPFDDIHVGKRKAVLYTITAATLLIAYTILFPTQVAVVALVFSLPVIIFLHELGHYTLAKRQGMLVTEFFVGFGPRLWSMQKGETEYGVKAIPLGGYCKVVGMTNLEDVDPAVEQRTYRSKPWHAKVSMAAAGPAMNFLIAFLLMFTVLYFAGNYRAETATTTLSSITNGAATAHAIDANVPPGLKPGDQLIAINGTYVNSWDQVHALVGGSPSRPAQPGDVARIAVRRGSQVIDFNVTLQPSADTGPKRAVVGIAPTLYVPHPGFLAAITLAPRQVFDVGWSSLKALGSVFSPAGISNYFHLLAGDKNSDASKRFVSPVGVAQLANDAVKAGWVEALGLLIVINVFLGLFNLFPLLPFDGGHIAVATYEKVASSIRRRRVQVDITKLMPLTVGVLAVLAFISITSIYLDVTKGISNPF